MTKVSIIVPIYKVEAYIERTLKSITDQTFTDYELILVDDGTPDKSIELASKYLSQFNNLDWRIIHQQNCGLSAARNTGISSAQGEWVICPDGDDYIDPRTLERMVKAAEETGADCVFCGHKSVSYKNIDERSYDNGRTLVYDSQEIKKRFLDRSIILLVPGMLLKREYYDRLQFDRFCPYDEDIHFLWRLLFSISRIAYIPTQFYNYLSRESSMVHSLKPEDYLKTSLAYAKMTEDIIKDHSAEKSFIKKIYPKYRLGGLHVLARSTDYTTFKKTVIEDGYRRDMLRLILHNNIKLSVYALLFCTSLRLFYLVSR